MSRAPLSSGSSYVREMPSGYPSYPSAVVHTIPQDLRALSQPTPYFIDNQLPDYLNIGMLGILRASTNHVVKRKRKLEAEMREAGLLPNGGPGPRTLEQELADGLEKRVRGIGRHVGAHVAERLTISRPPFPNDLETIKFICKEFFIHVYAKQIDNLRTNHRGTYVLQTNALPILVPLSSIAGSGNESREAQIYMMYPTGLIQGALEKLGILATVTAESNGLPRCTFQIKTQPTQPPVPSSAPLSAGMTSTSASTAASHPPIPSISQPQQPQIQGGATTETSSEGYQVPPNP